MEAETSTKALAKALLSAHPRVLVDLLGEIGAELSTRHCNYPRGGFLWTLAVGREMEKYKSSIYLAWVNDALRSREVARGGRTLADDLAEADTRWPA